jgi:methylated-DNA-[protein]-cysteine S-methyltransferase
MEPVVSAIRYLVFETALGFVGLGWSDAGLTRLVLPGRDRAATAKRLLRRDPDAELVSDTALADTPLWIRDLAGAIRAYASGEQTEFSAVPVDLAGVDDFRRAIYAEAKKLRFGETTTYGELAVRAGHPGLARETGAALGQNPVPLVIPCHRILAAGGKIGGFSAPGGSATKERMLALEGARVAAPPAQRAFGF